MPRKPASKPRRRPSATRKAPVPKPQKPARPLSARPGKVPARFRALGGVDPRLLPPGTPYPCADGYVGAVVRGDKLAGRIVSCATPPEGARGPHFVLGKVASGRAISGEFRKGYRAAEKVAAAQRTPIDVHETPRHTPAALRKPGTAKRTAGASAPRKRRGRGALRLADVTIPSISADDVKKDAQRYWSPRQQAYDPTMFGNSHAKTLAPLLIRSFEFDLAKEFYFGDWNKSAAKAIEDAIAAHDHTNAKNISRVVGLDVFNSHAGSNYPSHYWNSAYSHRLGLLKGYVPQLEELGMADVAEMVKDYLKIVDRVRLEAMSKTRKSVMSGLREMGLSESLIGTADSD